MTTNDTLRDLTGQGAYQGAERLVLNEIHLNGDGDFETDNQGQPVLVDGIAKRKGGYFRKRIWVGHEEGSGAPKEEKLGAEVRIIPLKIRRKLVERSTGGEIVRSTNEHNSPHDTVAVYEGKERVFVGSAAEARERYSGLRTVQLVYALLSTGAGTTEPELVRLVVRGASLGSEVRPKEEPTFYQYLSSFGQDPICSFVTKLGVILEKGKKDYYAMTFSRAGAVPDTLMSLVVEKLNYVAEYARRADQRLAAKQVAEETITAPEADAIQYPDEELNPEDIPF